MRKAPYYSRRTEKAGITLEQLSRFLLALYDEFVSKDYFTEAFGFECVDHGHIEGSIKYNVNKYLMRKTGKDNLWPIFKNFSTYSESDIFDVIEFLFDVVSAPLTSGDSYYHAYNGCGWHYSDFDKEAGQYEYLNEINEILSDYKEGFELSPYGEIQTKLESGLEPLFHRELPELPNNEAILESVQHAKKKYWDRTSTDLDRKDAIVQLGLILEPLRKRVKSVLRDDEEDLFSILNNFGFRHSKKAQKRNYESKVFDSWLFYHYLAAVHAYLKLLERAKLEKTYTEN